MGKLLIEETTLSAIGEAVRAKTGKTELLPPQNMPAEIAGISTGCAVQGTVSPSSAEKITVNDLGFKPTIVMIYLAPEDYHKMYIGELIFAEGGKRSGNYTLYFGVIMEGEGISSATCNLINDDAYTLTITDDGFEIVSNNPNAYVLKTSSVYNYIAIDDTGNAFQGGDGSYDMEIDYETLLAFDTGEIIIDTDEPPKLI